MIRVLTIAAALVAVSCGAWAQDARGPCPSGQVAVNVQIGGNEVIQCFYNPVSTTDGMWTYKLVCANDKRCPSEPIFDEDSYFSLESCREQARKIARAMHYKQGGDWAFQCFPADYEPKEMK